MINNGQFKKINFKHFLGSKNRNLNRQFWRQKLLKLFFFYKITINDHPDTFLPFIEMEKTFFVRDN